MSNDQAVDAAIETTKVFWDTFFNKGQFDSFSPPTDYIENGKPGGAGSGLVPWIQSTREKYPDFHVTIVRIHGSRMSVRFDPAGEDTMAPTVCVHWTATGTPAQEDDEPLRWEGMNVLLFDDQGQIRQNWHGQISMAAPEAYASG